MVEIHFLVHDLYCEIARQPESLPSVSSLLLMLFKHLHRKQLALALLAAYVVIPGIFRISDKGLINHIIIFLHRLFSSSY